MFVMFLGPLCSLSNYFQCNAVVHNVLMKTFGLYYCCWV